MSQIRTESITGLNNASTNNIDLSDDGTTTFNGPVVANRVKSGSSNLQYSYKSRTTTTIIPVPSWATVIEVDFYAFKATAAVSQYTTITPILANSTSASFSDFRLAYDNISSDQSYSTTSTGSGRWGSVSGSTSVNTMYLFANTTSYQYTYSGKIVLKKMPFLNDTGSSNIIYNIYAEGLYSGGAGGNGIWRYYGLMYGAGGDPDDVMSVIQFGTNGTNKNHEGSFTAQFREEDPGTLITT